MLRALALAAASLSACLALTPSVTVDPEGRYTISVAETGWVFSGSVGQPLTSLTTASGTDRLGDYQETVFEYTGAVRRQARIRAYAGKPVVIFTSMYPDGGANQDPFPALDTYPQDLYAFSYQPVWSYRFGIYGMSAGSPWVFFDAQANAFILSPASKFMIARTARNTNDVIECGIDPQIPLLPAGFTHQTMLVVSSGINSAFDLWGKALTDWQGKVRPPNDATPVLKNLGYWTDYGATYYYNPGESNDYQATLLGIRNDFLARGLPLGYLQLDSWYYPKGSTASWRNAEGGIYVYQADPELFPTGLAGFRAKLGAPLITHARWIDARSPYRQQYLMSDGVSVDAGYWRRIAADLKQSGVIAYEQDWLSGPAIARTNLSDPDAFLDNMAAAMQEQGIEMQYCMPLPRHFLQGSKYSNLTTIRVSSDRFERARWDAFLYDSRFASAMGIWPWVDVFMSSETDNLLLATLSAGPVGVGDRLGALNAGNLLRAARLDGLIVKPDVPVAPIDSSYINDALAPDRPMVAATYTDFGTSRAAYVVAYPRGADTTAVFTPSSLGLRGPVYIYNYFTGEGRTQDAGETFSAPISDGRAYYLVVPVGPSGIAFLGDLDQFVPLGRSRIASVSDDGALSVTVRFAPRETSRTIVGYASTSPYYLIDHGAAGPIRYDAGSGRFRVQVFPDVSGTVTLSFQTPRN